MLVFKNTMVKGVACHTLASVCLLGRSLNKCPCKVTKPEAIKRYSWHLSPSPKG